MNKSNPPPIVEMQLESGYFRPGAVALLSFLKHNPGFEAFVRDFGLQPSQKALLQNFAHVESAKQFNLSRRFSYVLARMEAFEKLVPDGGITLFLDGDTLTSGSLENWMDELNSSDCFVSMVREEKRFALKRQVDAQAFQSLPRLHEYGEKSGFNWGVVLVKRTPAAVCFFQTLSRQFRNLLGSQNFSPFWFKYYEQTYGNCLIGEHDIPVLSANAKYNSLIRGGNYTVDDGVLYRNGRACIVAHFLSGAYKHKAAGSRHARPAVEHYISIAKTFYAELAAHHRKRREGRLRTVRSERAERPAEENSSNPRVEIAVVTCQHFVERRRAVATTWGQEMASLKFFVGGDGPLEDARTVRLHCSDGYEDLPQKALAIFQWYVRQRIAFDWLFKCDDDTFVDVVELLRCASRLPGHYCGCLYNGRGGDFNRAYHISKVTEPGLKQRHPGVWRGPWCQGGRGYFLSRHAVETLAKYSCPIDDGELYEDKMVGDILRMHGIAAIACVLPTVHPASPSKMYDLHKQGLHRHTIAEQRDIQPARQYGA